MELTQTTPARSVVTFTFAGDPWPTIGGWAQKHRYLPTWAGFAEKNITEGPFFAGAKISVVDLKIHMAVRWFLGGKVDHIPATIFDNYPKLMGVHDAVRDHAGVKRWYAKS